MSSPIVTYSRGCTILAERRTALWVAKWRPPDEVTAAGPGAVMYQIDNDRACTYAATDGP
jgi:hypothetical protein